ncbi:MAG TPA: glycosyltransferase family 1 protein [Candidatus Angelobacter sp.]|nr:glycosyltransferase family 1 protein [Candidatus Angelobacter sp.]
MRVAIDSWVLASRLRHQGTYVYAQNMIAQFKKIAQASPDICFTLFSAKGSSNDAKLVHPGTGFALAETAWADHDRLWRLGGAGLAASRVRADVLFAPTSSILPLGRVPVVCTVHDVTPIKMPSHSRSVNLWSRALLRTSARRSRAIITDSACSKKDIISIYGVPEPKVSVVYLGFDKANFNEAAPDPELQKDLGRKLGIEKPYIMHHGVVQPRKNLKRLIEAYRLIMSRNRNLDLELVLAGPLGWECEEIVTTANATNGSRGKVIMTGALGDPDLAVLVKGASLAVIPSLYEGFCLPMVEAMACGTPAIASNASCLPEVSGGVLQYFDPHSVEDMADCMEKTLEDRKLLAELSTKGKQRAAFFDWQRCAAETLAVLKRNASGTRP